MFKELKLKNLSDYHDLYVQSDTLLVADLFENFRNKCNKIYELDPAHFFVCTWTRMANLFKKDKSKVKIELLTNIDMLLIVEKGTGGGIWHLIHQYVKTNNEYMKSYDKDMESSYLEYLDVNNLHGWALSQKRPVNGFEWVEELSQFREDFIKFFEQDSNKGYFLEVDVEYPKNSLSLHSDLLFLPERNKI